MTEKKNIFLTGGTGNVGSSLSEMLSLKSFKVKAVSRNLNLSTTDFNWYKLDISDATLNFDEILKNTDVIIHNAACLKAGKTKQELDEIENVNIHFTKKLLDYAVSFNIKKIIFTSSFSLIAKPLPEIITETSKINPETHYSNSKYFAEQMIQDYSQKHGINYNILRLSSPVNFNFDLMPENVVKKWIKQSINNETINVFGNGNRTQDFIATSDISAAYLNCIERNANGIFNLASGNTISMLEIAQLITSKYNNKYNFINVDENENDRWNISIEKSKNILNYTPQYTSKQVIQKLLNNISSCK